MSARHESIQTSTATKTKRPPKVAKPKAPDDLKKISGVGPKLEGGLNELGIGPRDLISILLAIKAAGALQAEIEVL